MDTLTPPATDQQRQARGRFAKGRSGNPKGRPAGARTRATLLLDKIGQDAAPDIVRALIEKAREGDLFAISILAPRVWPVRRGRPVRLDLPALNTAADLAAAVGAVAGAVAAGEITPEEGQSVAAVLELHRRAIETNDHEKRLAALEQQKN